MADARLVCVLEEGFPVYRPATSPDGELLAVPSGRGLWLYTWDGTLVGNLETSGSVYSAAFTAGGSYLAAGGEGCVYFWPHPFESSEPLRINTGTNAVAALTAFAADERLLSGGRDGIARLWDVRSGHLEKVLTATEGEIDAVAVSRDGRFAIVGADQEQANLTIWDLQTDETVVTDAADRIVTIAVRPAHDEMFAVGTRTGSIELWSLAARARLVTLDAHSGAVTGLSFDRGGRFLASYADEGTVLLWDVERRETVAARELADVEHYLYAGMQLHPDSLRVATPGRGGRGVEIWQLEVDCGAEPRALEETVQYTTARIALVGDSGVGKTTLGWRIVHDEFQPQESTHGQQFWVLDKLSTTRADGTECEVVLWDFAGQPDYRLVHSLFLEDIDCAVVVFDASNQEDPLRGVEYWLQQLKGARPQLPPTIVVGARADRGTPILGAQELDSFFLTYGVVSGVELTSARTGEGVERLLERIQLAIPWADLPVTVTSAAFHLIRSFLLAIKAGPQDGELLLRPAELADRLARETGEQFNEQAVLAISRLLRVHGYVEVLQSSSGEQFVLLASDLLVSLASSIILEARRNPRGLGALDESDLLQGRYDLKELKGLPDEQRRVLVDAAVLLFVSRHVCFRETLGAQSFLVFPSLINQNKPVSDAQELREDVTYHISGAVENVFAALVVLLGYTNTFRRTQQWRDQAQYEMGEGQICGFRRVATRSNQLEIVLNHGVEASAPARALFQGLFEEFLSRRDVEVVRYPSVTCTGCDYVQERSTVIRRISEGRSFLICEECGNRIELPEATILGAATRETRVGVAAGYSVARARSAYQTALVRLKALARDRGLGQPTCFVSYAWGSPEQSRWVERLATDLSDAGVNVLLDVWQNAAAGSNIARFVSQIESSDFIVVVGTPLYRQKYENKVSDTGSVVAAEVDLINIRLTGRENEKATVIPVLLDGDLRRSLPPLLRARVACDFSSGADYFASLLDLVLTLYRFPFEDAAVRALRTISKAA